MVRTVDKRTIVIIPTFMPNSDYNRPALWQRRSLTLWVPRDLRPCGKRLPLTVPRRAAAFGTRLRTSPCRDHLWTERSTYGWSTRSTLLGIRARDGTIVAETGLAGRSNSIQPLHHDGVLYVTSQAPDGGGMLQAFSIGY